MSQRNRREIRETIYAWWSSNIGNRGNNPAARALAARLRRATGVEALAEPAVHRLAQSLGLGKRDRDAHCLIRLATVLAEVRVNDRRSLAALLGKDKALSQSRFQRLIRSTPDELAAALRRALPMVERQCNVGTLGADLFFWNDETRVNWCFEYFGAALPQTPQTANTEDTEA